jgi:hypothetical protein
VVRRIIFLSAGVGVCVVMALYFAIPGSWLGASYMLAEGFFVGVLATVEARTLKAVTCVAFLDAPTFPNNEVFRDMPHAQTGETPYIQRHHFGAVIATRIAAEQVQPSIYYQPVLEM